MNPWTSKRFASAASAALAGALCLAAAAPPLDNSDLLPAHSTPDSLVLRNGDSLDGKLLAIDSRRGLRWKNSDVADPIEFKLPGIAQIFLHPPARAADSPCKVFLLQGDVLEGSLVSCSRDNLVLQTWYAGQIKIPRKSLQSVYFPPLTPDIFTLTGPDGWTQGQSAVAFVGGAGDWTYRAGAYYASKPASIARDLKLPPTADIQFDMAWTGDLTLAVGIYTDSLQPIPILTKDAGPDFGGFYSMRFQPMGAVLGRIKKMENPVIYLPGVVVPAFTQSNHVHISIRARKQSNTIALSVDGQMLGLWNDTNGNGFVGEGTGMRFVHNGLGIVKISDLRVTPWDGLWESGQTNTPVPGHEIVSLTNATTLAGAIETVADGKMILRGKRDKTEVPLAQVRRLSFAAMPEEPAKAADGSVRANFAHGGTLTFQLESWSPEGVNIRSPVFGPAKFNPDAFERLQFLPTDGARN